MSKKPSVNSTSHLRIKRVYEAPAEDDGLRVLVDRLWPRGLTKAKADVDLWLKDIAPSDELRRMVHGDPSKWEKFVAAYRRELAQEPARTAAAGLREHTRQGTVTLLYGARNETRNNAVALKEWLESNKAQPASKRSPARSRHSN
jgi:uncharacterized protein YeaO (DUF488 family)